MRVLYISNFYESAHVYGGPSRSVPALCQGLAQAGAAVTVFTTNANGAERLDVPFDKPVTIHGVEVRYFPLAINAFFYSPDLTAAAGARVNEFDIVEIDCLFGHGLDAVSAACRLAKVPYAVPLRGQLLPWALRQHSWRKRAYMAWFGKRCLDKAAALHCTSAAEAEAIGPLGLRAPAIIVPNPIDAAGFANLPARGGLRRRLGIDPAAFVLLLLGRLHEVKRPDIAVRTLAAAMQSGRPVHLLIAGPDTQNMTQSLCDLAASLNCAGGLHILPLMGASEIRQAFADSDLLLMPSESENFGMAAAEAMAAGLPVLCSESVPIGQEGARAGAARCVAGNANAFASAVHTLIAAPPGELTQMGQRGRELIRTTFDRRIVARQLLAHFESIVSGGSRIERRGPVLDAPPTRGCKPLWGGPPGPRGGPGLRSGQRNEGVPRRPGGPPHRLQSQRDTQLKSLVSRKEAFCFKTLRLWRPA